MNISCMFTGLNDPLIMSKHALRTLVFLTGLFSFQLSFAQTEILQNAPPGIKWNQINTSHFRIIFDEKNNENALRLANSLENLYSPVSNR